ncbi:MAG: outer membrane receptor for ferrienterochelin and colicins, partial [Sphingobacteriales bacterium]
MNSIGRILILGVFSLFSTLSFGQKLKGKLVNENQEPWAFASIIWAGTQIGTTTDENGNFKIERQDKALVISHLSFETDTLAVPDPLPNPWIIQVSSGIELKTFNVVDRNGGTRINMLDPKNIEVLGSEELTKAACCNLSEAFETNASVDVSSSDASTGLKEIYMLGLNGNNILFTQGNIPDQLGIDRPFGLMSIPGPWLSEIAISKGVSSVVNASEGLAGQINYCEEPYGENQGRVNVYGNAFGRMETNVGARIGSDEEWNHRLQGHFSQRKGKIDKNKDGFYDVPEMTSSALSYQAQKETKKMHLNFFVRASDHTIDGGQTSSVPGSLKTSLKHDRIKVGGKVGFKGKTPGNSFGIQYFGKSSNSTGKVYNKTYNFQENRVYVNAIYQTFIQSSDYKIKSGISLNVLEQDISFFQPSNSIGPHDKNTTVPTNRYANPLILPAPFTELDATFNEKWSGVFGLRFIPSP